MKRFSADASGATAIEYTLIAMLIAFVIIAAVTTIGTKVNIMIDSVNPGFH